MVETTTERATFEVPAWLPADTEESVVGTQWHLIAPALHAWRLEEGAYVPWVADDDGWWRSRSLGIGFQPTQPFMTICDREGRQLSLPHQAFEREYTLEHELAEAQRRIAEMEAHLRALRGDGASGESGDVSPP